MNLLSCVNRRVLSAVGISSDRGKRPDRSALSQTTFPPSKNRKEDAAELCPGLPWPEIRGIGNWLRHQYDRVDLETLWNPPQDDLPPLSASVRRALSNPPTKDSTPQP